MPSARFPTGSTALRGVVVTSIDGDGRCVVWVGGEHDLSTVDLLAAALARAIVRNEFGLVVDLRAVEFLDASILAVLLRADMLTAARGQLMTIRSPSRAARHVLEILAPIVGGHRWGDPGSDGRRPILTSRRRHAFGMPVRARARGRPPDGYRGLHAVDNEAS